MSFKKVKSFISNFSNKEVKSFSEFIASPYFNKKQSIKLFYSFIIAKPQILKEKEIDLKALNKATKASYTKQTLKKELHLFGKLLEEFIHYNQLKEDKENEQHYSLVKYCLENRIHPLYNIYNSKIDQLEKVESVRFGDFYLSRFKIENLRQRYNTYFNETRSGDNNLQNALDSLDKYYLLEKLDLLRAINSRNAAVEFDYNFRLKSSLLDLASSDEFSQIFSIKLEMLIFKLQNNIDSIDSYIKIRTLIDGNQNLINKERLLNVIIILTNSLKKIFSGKSYYEEVFKLYALQIKLGLMLDENNIIYSSTLKNVITVALNLEKIEWAEAFLEEYSKFLPKTERSETYYFNLANIQFEKKEFSEALENLNKSFPKDVLIALAIKRLYLKLFYELNDFSLFDSFYHSLNMYIRRLKSISTNHIKYNKLFLKHIHSLVKIKTSPDTSISDSQALLEKINAEQILPEKKWLVQKLEAEL